MSKKSNPTVIGAFVVGATVLLATGVAVFGGAELFAARNTYVAYFTENTQGLRVGSNVMMNGVNIGSVSKMALYVDQDSWVSKTEVTIEVRPDSFIPTSEGEILGRGPDALVSHDVLINEGGLRAELEAESLVTGQLLVELVFKPNQPAIMRSGEYSEYPEIPTISSEIQQVLADIKAWASGFSESVNPKELGERLSGILQGVDELVNSEDLRATLAGVNSVVNDDDTQQLTATMQATFQEVSGAARSASALLKNADTKLDSPELKLVVDRLASTLGEAQEALAAAKTQLRGESIGSYQLGMTLKEVEGAARALREFLDYLEQNPEAILKGKQQ